MKNIFLFLIFLIAKNSFAQDKYPSPLLHPIGFNYDSAETFKKNTMFGELGGNLGLVSSLNYERKLFDNSSGFFTARVGIGVNVNGFGSVIWGPAFLLNYINGKDKNHFEIGLGTRLPEYLVYDKRKKQYSSGWGDNDILVLAFTTNVMYRYQKPEGKFVFRIGWTPLFYAPQSKYDVVSGLYWFFCGTSIGYAF